ncbi:MAG TPA: GntR family transcriptional regulator [Oceanospirillales bacterium]|nr:GntR family transcriptional regulator [Oceanospirillales bacterium]
MALLGKNNLLTVLEKNNHGYILEAGHLGHVFLSDKWIDKSLEVNAKVEVFLYLDTNDEIAATTLQPKIQLHECAYLKCVDMNKIGAFFDWGLPKDLMVPYAEQPYKIYPDLYYSVYMYQDSASKRLVGSLKLSKYLNEFNTDFKPKQAVDLFIVGKSQLGYKAIINKTHLGLVHHSDVFKPVRLGQNVQGFIKDIRADKKINLCFNLPDSKQLGSLASRILEDLKQNNGQSNMTDASAPAEIYAKWNVSKGSYKKALGALYKQKLITLSKTEIKLVE